jgi:hypothetical protein
LFLHVIGTGIGIGTLGKGIERGNETVIAKEIFVIGIENVIGKGTGIGIGTEKGIEIGIQSHPELLLEWAVLGEVHPFPSLSIVVGDEVISEVEEVVVEHGSRTIEKYSYKD